MTCHPLEPLHAEIDERDAEIERLSAKAAKVEAKSRQKYFAEMVELKFKRDQLEEKLEEIQELGEVAFLDLKFGVELTLETMNEPLKSAASRFKWSGRAVVHSP